MFTACSGFYYLVIVTYKPNNELIDLELVKGNFSNIKKILYDDFL